MKSCLPPVFLLLTIILCSSDAANLEKEKQRILDDLLDPEKYDKRVRPNGDGPTNVGITMYVLDIIDMDQYLKEFTLQFYFRQHWTDERLAFRKENTTIRRIRAVETGKFWKPDLFFTNEIKGEMHNLMVPNNMLRVSDDGKIMFSNRVSVIFGCQADLKFFPHDEQKCVVTIESYGYGSNDLTVHWDSDKAVGFGLALSSDPKYILLHFAQKRSSTTINGTDYNNLDLELHFARNFHAFLTTMYGPQILLVILSWAVFCMDHKNVTIRLVYLGLIIFLMLRLIPADRDPDLHLTALDIWIAVCMMFILSSFLESIFVSQAANQEDHENLKDQDAEQQAINSGHMNVEKLEKQSDDSKGGRLFGRLTRKYSTNSKRVDVTFRVVTPVLFLFFNILYWSICCSASKYD